MGRRLDRSVGSTASAVATFGSHLEEPVGRGCDRRAFLRRVAVGAAVVWAAPAISTISASPASATPAPEPGPCEALCRAQFTAAMDQCQAARDDCLRTRPNKIECVDEFRGCALVAESQLFFCLLNCP